MKLCLGAEVDINSSYDESYDEYVNEDVDVTNQLLYSEDGGLSVVVSGFLTMLGLDIDDVGEERVIECLSSFAHDESRGEFYAHLPKRCQGVKMTFKLNKKTTLMLRLYRWNY